MPAVPLDLKSTLAETGEFALIDAITAIFPQGEQVLVGPGDDAAVLRIRNGHVVVSTDLMVEGRHFRREWAPAEDIGARAAAQNLSDVNAMGGTATSLTVGLALPADLTVEWVLGFARGFAAECSKVGASVVGGDITRSDQVVIAVTVMGAARSRRCCDPVPSPVTSWHCAGGRGGPPVAWPSWGVGSARRECWSRPTAGPSRRTPPAGSPPRREPPP